MDAYWAANIDLTDVVPDLDIYDHSWPIWSYAEIGVSIGYDENLAHLIQAGCAALVVPSRFEPCGLTQLCASPRGLLASSASLVRG